MIEPLTIMTIETAIIRRLRALITDLSVEPFPDAPERWRLTDRRGHVLVAWRGDVFSEPKDVGAVVQERSLEFDIHVLTRDLAGHGGAYFVVETVRLALAGFKIPGCTPLRPVRTKFLGSREREGVWTYVLTIATALPAIALADEEIIPLLHHLTVLDGQTGQPVATIPHEVTP